MSAPALASDETGIRVSKANWWLWVFHHGDSAAFVIERRRSKAVVEAFLGDHRPDYWISDGFLTATEPRWAGQPRSIRSASPI
jgi:transposase